MDSKDRLALRASQRKDQEINNPASLSSFPLISCQGLLIGQIQSKAPGEKVRVSTDGARAAQVPRAGAGGDGSGEANGRHLPAQHPPPPRESNAKPFPRSCLCSALHSATWKEKDHERPKKHPLAQKPLSWCPGPHPRAAPQEVHEAGSCHSFMSLLGSPLCFRGCRHLAPGSKLLVRPHSHGHILVTPSPRWPMLKRGSEPPGEPLRQRKCETHTL